MQRELRHLVRMTNNVLLYTQLDSESARQVLMPIDLGELVDEVVEDMHYYSSGHLVEVQGVSRGMTVMGDYDLLKAASTNVIENATKFTRPSGTIVVSLTDLGDAYSLSVVDDGVGIRPEDLPRVTEPYYRADNGTAGRNGPGLGLTLVDQIVRLHEGHLSISSSPDEGTNVTIELAKAPLEAAGVRPSLAGISGHQRGGPQ
jgi:signal transduction histidine kinase